MSAENRRQKWEALDKAVDEARRIGATLIWVTFGRPGMANVTMEAEVKETMKGPDGQINVYANGAVGPASVGGISCAGEIPDVVVPNPVSNFPNHPA
jgi:hypothetical protein